MLFDLGELIVTTPQGLNVNSCEYNFWLMMEDDEPTLQGLNVNSHECNSWLVIEDDEPTPKGLNVPLSINPIF